MRTADECLYRSKKAGRNRTTAVEIPALVDLSLNGAADSAASGWQGALIPPRAAAH